MPDRRHTSRAAAGGRCVPEGRTRANRQRPPQTITVEGEDELHALMELVLALRELNRPGRMADIEQRARQAFLSGAEERSRRVLDRGMADDEVRRVIRRYPGDPPTEA